MSADQLILCGGVKLTSRAKRWTSLKPRRLRIGKGKQHVHLDIESIPRALVANLPDVAVDMVEMAAYVYAADQLCRRGGEREFEYGQKWRRHFRFEVPVRDLDRWTDPTTRNALTDTLGFLSDDDYEFHFVEHKSPPPLTKYIPFAGPTNENGAVDEVILFSGGLDSFGGAVREILQGQRRVALVSHVSTEKIGKPQRELAADIMQAATPGTPEPLHIQVSLNKDKAMGRDSTQRTRSFVYAIFAGVVARGLGRDRVRVYENGVVSFNLPTSLQVIGGRASRTTHPRTLTSLGTFLSAAFGSEMRIENPFLWKTKAEMLQEIKAAGHAEMCRHTISCAHTIARTTQHSHCGRCSQCIDRRLVALAAGYDDTQDPAVMYESQMDSPLTDPRDVTTIERYIGAALRIRQMPDEKAFLAEFGEVSRALRHLGVDAETGLKQTFALHKRHSEQVYSALKSLLEANLDAIVQQRVPATSPIGIAGRLGVSASEIAEQDAAAADAAAVDPSFRVDDETFKVWNGGEACYLGNTIEFRAIQRLARRPGQYLKVDVLRDSAWDGAIVTKNAVQKTMSNIRRKLQTAGVEGVTIDGSQRDHYALKISACGKG